MLDKLLVLKPKAFLTKYGLHTSRQFLRAWWEHHTDGLGEDELYVLLSGLSSAKESEVLEQLELVKDGAERSQRRQEK